MQPWFETIGVIFLILLGMAVGHTFSLLRKPYWILGYIIPLTFIFMVGATRYFSKFEFIVPFSWLTEGMREFVVLSMAITMLFSTLLRRLANKRLKVLIIIFMIIAAVYYSVTPFFYPILIRNELEQLETNVDHRGFCTQSTDYTCGPAAAVTALRKFGIKAEEGKIAILAHTTPFSGTPPDILCKTLQDRYGPEGLSCEYRLFHSIDELKEVGTAIALVKYSFLIDHYITILGFNDFAFIVADPLVGKKRISYKEFKEIWRYSAIVINQ